MGDLVGRRLGRYTLLDVVRSRRHSTTYRARSGDRDVDVTVLPPLADPTLRDACIADARRVAQLRHANIVPIEDIGVQDGQVYVVTAHTGAFPTLADLTLPLSPARVVAVLAPLLSGLQHAHEHAVVHADITPRRVVLPSPTWPMLTDFTLGAAAVAAGVEAAGRRVVLGTPAYLAPEQAFGLRPGGPADVYSLALVGYELLTGRVPFEGDTPAAVLRLQAYAPPPPPRAFHEGLPERLEAAVLRALAKDPLQRPSAAALAEELRAAVAKEPVQPTTSAPEPLAGEGLVADYSAGVQAFADGRWDEAVLLLGAVAQHDPGYEDVDVLLRAAQTALAQADD